MSLFPSRDSVARQLDRACEDLSSLASKRHDEMRKTYLVPPRPIDALWAVSPVLASIEAHVLNPEGLLSSDWPEGKLKLRLWCAAAAEANMLATTAEICRAIRFAVKPHALNDHELANALEECVRHLRKGSAPPAHMYSSFGRSFGPGDKS